MSDAVKSDAVKSACSASTIRDPQPSQQQRASLRRTLVPVGANLSFYPGLQLLLHSILEADRFTTVGVATTLDRGRAQRIVDMCNSCPSTTVLRLTADLCL
jgi:hypothetical protein